MKSKTLLPLLALGLTLCLTGCSREFDVDNGTGTGSNTGAATATTGSATPDYVSARCYLSATAPSSAPLTDAGICCCKGYGTPTTSNLSVPLRSRGIDVNGKTSVSDYVIVGVIERNTTYSYRAYAVNSHGTAYGATKTFTTK
ncbi:MAG: hypothetical protein IJ524_08995 [Bacteroidales bacterium]|nr:hypothetical protein [Bacteroidales bacterium]